MSLSHFILGVSQLLVPAEFISNMPNIKGQTGRMYVKTDKVKVFEMVKTSRLQKVLINIVVILVILSFTLSFTVFGFLLGKGASVTESVSFTVVLIIASIPVAIEIVCTTTLALGSKELSKHGAIVTRLAAIEDMAGMNMLCSDKTGTLTMNKMMIQEETPIYYSNETQ
jgi:P-type E1-E2 ATPase